MRYVGSVLAAAGLLWATGCGAEPAGAPRGGAAYQHEQAAQAPPSGRPVPQPSESVPAGMQIVQIVDRRGFEKPMVSAIMFAPKGWKTRGGVVWNPNPSMSGCGINTPHVNWTATAPDGSGMISLLPEETWTMAVAGAPMLGLPPQCQPKPTDAKAFVLGYAGRHRPDARVLDYRDDPEALRIIMAQLPPDQNLAGGYGLSRRAGAGQLLIAYPIDGREMREIIGVGVVYTQFKQPQIMPGVSRDMMIIATTPGYAMRMPEGLLDFKQAGLIRASIKPNPAYQARMQKHHAKQARMQAETNARIAAINARGAAERARTNAESSRAISQTYSDIGDIQMRGWQNRQQMTDRGQRETVEVTGGFETYNDPSASGTVQLDNTYERAFQLDDGTNVLTNDPSFDPYRYTGQDGVELEPTQ